MSESFGADICECGDYRSQHDEKGCQTCKNSTAPWEGCVKFRLSRSATPADLAHWRQYHASQITQNSEGAR